jgi:hypothetical protein
LGLAAPNSESAFLPALISALMVGCTVCFTTIQTFYWFRSDGFAALFALPVSLFFLALVTGFVIILPVAVTVIISDEWRLPVYLVIFVMSWFACMGLIARGESES